MEQNGYDLPPVLKRAPQVVTLGSKLKVFFASEDETALERRRQEREFVRTIQSGLTTSEMDKLAVQAALGKVRLPYIIPPFLNDGLIKRFGPLCVSAKLAMLYTLMCSSLYYETRQRHINAKEGRKYAERLHELFRNNLGSLSTDKLFRNMFKVPLIAHQSESPTRQEIPEDLLGILNFPRLMRENFMRFFDELDK